MARNLDHINAMVFDRPATDFPAYTRHRAALMMLDTIGIAAAAAPMDAGVIARDAATMLFASNDATTRARMMFDGRYASFAGAAFALATQIDNLDGHDGFNPAKGHVGVAVLPTLAALLDTGIEMSGHEALATVITGYEVACRAALSLHATVSDYHTSGAWNTLGVVTMCARAMKMTPEQMRQALGIAEFHGPRSQMMREIANPTMLHDGSGWGTMVGLSAVHMARNGFTGAPAITIEDGATQPFWQDMGSVWHMENQYVKPYPICRWAHAAIDAVRTLIIAHDIGAEDIAALDIHSFHEAVCLYPGMPDTTSQAQYSLAFAVASYVVNGTIGLAQISGGVLVDARVAALIARINVAERDRHNDRFPIGRWADVTIRLHDGRILESGDVPARGGEEQPLSDAEIEDKYFSYAAPALGDTRAAMIRDAIMGLETAQAQLADLRPLIFDPLG